MKECWGRLKMESKGNAIEVTDLRKTYRGNVEALKGLSFSVANGEVFGLLGPNGAGKSTTVRILVTLSSPTSGSATVAGLDVAKHSLEVRRRIGYISQNSTVDVLATGRENLVLQGQLYHLEKKSIHSRVNELLKLFNLADAAERLVQTYSGGMKRRLDVAMGLVHRPEILILDEPTSALDPESRAVLWRELRRLSKEDRLTILFTTHYLEEADREASRVAIVDKGRVVATGKPEELKSTLRGDVVSVTLAADSNAESAAEVLRGHEGVINILVNGLVLHTQVPNGARQLPGIVGAIEGAGFHIGEVGVSRPSLDEVYLSVTGRRFEDADSAAPQAAAAGFSR